MKDLRLTKKGFYGKVYDFESRSSREGLINMDFDFLSFWNVVLTIDEDVLFEDVINILKEAQEKDTLVVIEMITQSSVEPFLKETDNKAEANSDLSHLEISKHYEIKDYRDQKVSEWTESVRCSGVYKEPKKCSETGHVDTCCSVGFTSWAELMKLPIKLAPTAEIQKWHKDPKITTEYTVETFYTMGDFFLGLFDELCFDGSPAGREERKEELMETLRGIEDGTVELIPWDDVKESLEEKIKDKG